MTVSAHSLDQYLFGNRHIAHAVPEEWKELKTFGMLTSKANQAILAVRRVDNQLF